MALNSSPSAELINRCTSKYLLWNNNTRLQVTRRVTGRAQTNVLHTKPCSCFFLLVPEKAVKREDKTLNLQKVLTMYHKSY